MSVTDIFLIYFQNFLMYFQNFLIGSYFLLKKIGITSLKIQDYLGKLLLFILSPGLSVIF